MQSCPQGRFESINHAKAAGVPIIDWRSNKIDKPTANAQRFRTGPAASTRSSSKAWVGEVLDVEVSALKQINLDKWLDAILLQAELLRPRGPIRGPHREGVVIEAKLDRAAVRLPPFWSRPVTLRPGDIPRGRRPVGPCARPVNGPRRAGQGSRFLPFPVEILGLQGTSSAGGRPLCRSSRTKKAVPARFAESASGTCPHTRRCARSGAEPAVPLEQMMTQFAGYRGRRILPAAGQVRRCRARIEPFQAPSTHLGTDGGACPHHPIGAPAPSPKSRHLARRRLSGARAIIGFNVPARQQAGAATRPNATVPRSATTTSNLRFWWIM